MPVNSFENYPMSWKPKIKQGTVPLYKELADILQNDIRSGKLLPGTKLPPQRELADYLDINLSTVSRAFELCKQKGFISATIGSGTFVSSDIGVNGMFCVRNDGSRNIEMGPILPEIKENKIVASMARKILSEPNAESMFQYSQVEGSFVHRKAAVKLMEMCKLKATTENIVIGLGGQNAIFASLASLFNSGDRIGVCSHVYPGIKIAAQILGIQLIPIREKDNEITEEGLNYAINNDNIKGLYISPDYANPTTNIMKDSTRKFIADAAIKNNIMIIEDAINTLLCDEILKPVKYYAPHNTIYILSVSKVISPGLRISFIAPPAKIKDKMLKVFYGMNISAPPILLEITSRLILLGYVDKIVSERKKNIIVRNQIVDKYLEKFEVLGDKNSPFRWAYLPDGMSGKEFEAKALKNGLQVYAADRFAFGTVKPENAIRIAITSEKNNKEFVEGIKILKRILCENIDT